jgi:hypothetical protein
MSPEIKAAREAYRLARERYEALLDEDEWGGDPTPILAAERQMEDALEALHKVDWADVGTDVCLEII